MPLWNANNANTSPKSPTWYHGKDREHQYATRKGWVKRHAHGTEEVLVAIEGLDATIGAATVQSNTSGGNAGVYFSNTANSYVSAATGYVNIDFDQTLSVLQLIGYTGIAGNTNFANGETITQGAVTGTVAFQNSTYLSVYSGGASAVGRGSGVLVVTANTATKITGLTSSATANISTITGPVINVSSVGAYTSNTVASFAGLGVSNNQLLFSFTVPSVTGNSLMYIPTSLGNVAVTIPYTGFAQGPHGGGNWNKGDTITQGTTTGTFVSSNSSAIIVIANTGTFTTTSNSTTTLVDNQTGATANAVATITFATFSTGDTIVQGNQYAILIGANTSTLTANIASSMFLPGTTIIDANSGVTANLVAGQLSIGALSNTVTSVPYTGIATGTFVVGDVVSQSNGTSNIALGTVFLSNSTVVQVTINTGAFIVTTNTANNLRDANSGATANAVATITTTGFTVGDTVTQTSGATGVLTLANSTVLGVNTSVGLFANAVIKDANSGVYATAAWILPANATLYLANQTIGTNSTVNIVGNNAVNATPTFVSNNTIAVQAIVNNPSGNVVII